MICLVLTDVGIRTCICGVEEVSDAIEDKGEAGNWPFFPILSLNFGDTNSIGKEFVEYFIGPLVCKQGISRFCLFRTIDFKARCQNKVVLEAYSMWSNLWRPKVFVYWTHWIYFFKMHIRVLSCFHAWNKKCLYWQQTVEYNCFQPMIHVCMFNADEILYRWFNTNPDKRLAVDVTAINWATTAGKCAMSCLSTYNCISFNFQKNLRSICELSSLPWDAKHANYQPLVGWAHYAMRLA